MLKAENLKVHFKKGLFSRKLKALDGLSLNVERGDFFALIGQNGAGKSTAMYCFLGLLQPTSGSVEIFGEPPRLGSGTYQHIAYLPEEPHYHLYLTVEEAVTYYGSLYGTRVTSKLVRETLDRLGLLEFRDLRLAKCSKGMKQKVGIAQCIITRPQLLFLDEPTRGLDPIVVKEFRDILLGLNKRGTTIIMNSHILSEIEAVANKVAIIEKGKVIAQESMSKMLNFDSEVYGIEFTAPDAPLPDYLSDAVKTSQGMKGTIPASQFYDFMDYARDAGVKVLECTHKRATLEESYINILKGSKENA